MLYRLDNKAAKYIWEEVKWGLDLARTSHLAIYPLSPHHHA